VNVAAHFTQMLTFFARTMANVSALGMRQHPHAVHLCWLAKRLKQIWKQCFCISFN